MSEIRPNNPIEELILRYLSGEASDADVRELEAWVQANAENQALYTEMKKVWMLSGMAEMSDLDVNQEWRKLKERVGLKQSTQREEKQGAVVRMRPARMLMRIAAAIALLLLAGTAVYTFMLDGEKQFVAGNAPENIQLADGSTVVLNRQSQLTWDKKAKDKRSVQLQGDAFFEVARDEAKPFVVTAGDLEIEVLGTEFYVDARTGNTAIDVFVEDGRVAVRTMEAEVILNAGERATFNTQAKTLQQQENTDPNFTSIRTQRLAFEDARLTSVADALNRHFHAEIIVQPSVEETCELTATFENKSLDAILQIIASTIGIDIVRRNQQIILSGTCSLH